MKWAAERHVREDKVGLVRVGGPAVAQATPWVCSLADCKCSANLVAHGRTELTNCLAGRSFISAHRVQQGRKGAALWEHAAEQYFAILLQFCNSAFQGQKQHVNTSGRRGGKKKKRKT